MRILCNEIQQEIIQLLIRSLKMVSDEAVIVNWGLIIVANIGRHLKLTGTFKQRSTRSCLRVANFIFGPNMHPSLSAGAKLHILEINFLKCITKHKWIRGGCLFLVK